MKKIITTKKSKFLISLVLFKLLILTSSSFSFQEKRALIEDNNYFPSYSLIGIILSDDPTSSIAVLKDEKNKKMIMLKIGESILDMKCARLDLTATKPAFTNHTVFYLPLHCKTPFLNYKVNKIYLKTFAGIAV